MGASFYKIDIIIILRDVCCIIDAVFPPLRETPLAGRLKTLLKRRSYSCAL